MQSGFNEEDDDDFFDEKAAKEKQAADAEAEKQKAAELGLKYSKMLKKK